MVKTLDLNLSPTEILDQVASLAAIIREDRPEVTIAGR